MEESEQGIRGREQILWIGLGILKQLWKSGQEFSKETGRSQGKSYTYLSP